MDIGHPRLVRVGGVGAAEEMGRRQRPRDSDAASPPNPWPGHGRPRRIPRPSPSAATRSEASFCASALLVLDSVLVALIIAYVPRSLLTLSLPVDGFLGGERDCTKLKGDTGPLVYPAGFLYVYSAIKFLTGGEFRTENCPM
ncbi:hypothetical protein B296_00009779 [Ensete ventricosum]|uniref:dolichyl-P-Man:Man5GlcNAc2-PP-dolichol alpha-1,3-mannosyltransferase n=1 Tax=Ensete ventricosum TaxID=4639 RepID=A0A426ZLK8_ENSVE|nr:hypothetical protein B296_00009779 [Ensete ventricosum]